MSKLSRILEDRRTRHIMQQCAGRKQIYFAKIPYKYGHVLIFEHGDRFDMLNHHRGDKKNLSSLELRTWLELYEL